MYFRLIVHVKMKAKQKVWIKNEPGVISRINGCGDKEQQLQNEQKNLQ